MKSLFKFLTTMMLVGIVFSIFTAAAYAGSPIYVHSNDGDDTCNGSNETLPSPDCPVKTIQRGLELVDTGGLLIVRAGAYAENLTITRTLTLQGDGPGSTTINGGGVNRVITNTVALTITGVTITNGQAENGGGIHNQGALIINDVVITHNTVISDGGGIYNYKPGVLSMTNSTVISNSAGDDGGGLANQDGIATLDNTTVSDNIAGDGLKSVGGGISNAAQTVNTTLILLNQSQITTNTIRGVGGGGISNSANSGFTATLVLTQSLVSSNVATATTVNSTVGYGGGIRNGYFDGVINGAAAYLTVISSTIKDNQAINGGGIGSGTQGTLNTTTRVTMNNSTVSGNIAAGYGNMIGNSGGLANLDGVMSLVNSTVSGNTAQGTGGPEVSGYAGGVGNTSGGLATTLWLTNTTLANNTAATLGTGTAIGNLTSAGSAVVNYKNTLIAGTCSNIGGGTLVSYGYNLENGNTCNLTATGDLTNTLPNLYVLADNGGDTQTHRLLYGSYAIDTGACSGASLADQRGQPRPNAITPYCDIGAYESDLPGVADLQISKTVNTDPVNPGDTITYTLTFTNAGPAGATGVVITDELPITLTQVTSTTSGALITSTSGSNYHWTAANLLKGEGGLITITGKISAALTVGGRFTNTASIAGLVTDDNSANNSGEVGVTINEVDLELGKTAVYDMALDGITTITYTLTVSNNEVTTLATGVVVSDTLPLSVSLVSASGAYNAGVWTVGDVTGGGQAVLTLVVTGTLNVGQTITNTAVITHVDQVDRTAGNNTAVVTTTVTSSGPGPVYLPIIIKASP